ncbi:MAG TPA: hypothetical protein VG165_16090 [Solirubrobacteraceae bacterium]|jgi:hypothetical protein|nr:hypothetical protein [Solirubrobacteraceae bacterium]
MSTQVKVGRYHLIQWVLYVAMPWAALAFSFAINLVINLATNVGASNETRGLTTIYAFMFIGGLLATTRSLPFALALGLSRRSYYLGTALFAVGLAAVYGLALTLLATVERGTGGWGTSLHFFSMAYILDGPWYQTWLTSFVALALVFVYGMWFGLVHRRWNLTGLTVFIAAQITAVLAGLVVATSTHAWNRIGHFFTALTATGLTGVLAALTVVLIAGGLATMRRVTV